MTHLRLTIVVDFPHSAAEYRKLQAEYGEHDGPQGPELPRNWGQAELAIREHLAWLEHSTSGHENWEIQLRDINGHPTGRCEIKNVKGPKR